MNEGKESKNVFRDFKTNIVLTIPPQIFMIETIKPIDVMIYIFITAMSYKKGYCWATTETIMASLNIGSNATVISSIKKLEKLNFVRTQNVVSNGVKRRMIFPINQAFEKVVNENRHKLDQEKYNENIWKMIEDFKYEEETYE